MSPDADHGFPRFVWAMSDDGFVLEARCDDPRRGKYHGYPLEAGDPIAETVRRRWQEVG